MIEIGNLLFAPLRSSAQDLDPCVHVTAQLRVLESVGATELCNHPLIGITQDSENGAWKRNRGVKQSSNRVRGEFKLGLVAFVFTRGLWLPVWFL